MVAEKGTEGLDRVEQRRHPRRSVNWPVQVIFPGKGTLYSTATDISPGGIGVYTVSIPIQPEEFAIVVYRPDKCLERNLCATVAWCSDSSFGLAFRDEQPMVDTT